MYDRLEEGGSCRLRYGGIFVGLWMNAWMGWVYDMIRYDTINLV